MQDYINAVYSRMSKLYENLPVSQVTTQEISEHLAKMGGQLDTRFQIISRVLCYLTTPGLKKDIRHQIQQLCSHKVTYYVHYNYILLSHLLSYSRMYYYY